MIPKIFHHVWLGGRPLPPLFQGYRSRFQELHPQWEFRLWTDDECQQLDCQPLLAAWNSQSAKSNAVRLEVLQRFGGVYVDTDVEPLKAFDILLDVEAFAAEEYRGRVCNAVMGAVPQHPWIDCQLKSIPQYKNKSPPWGPEVSTLAYQEMSEQGTKVTLYPSFYFYPYLWDRLSLRGSNEFPDSFAVHHWAISWNPKLAWEFSR